MRIIHACPAACKRLPVDESTPPVAIERERKLNQIEQMVQGGMKRCDALKVLGLAKSTYYDWRKAFRERGIKGLVPKSTRPRRVRGPQWTAPDRRRVEALRRQRPWAGRAAIHAILSRDSDFTLSVSTVGRILAQGVERGRIQPAAFCDGRVKAKKRRTFKGHAQRLKPGRKAKRPGELVQFDHMTVHVDGRTFKEFHAKDPVTKALHVKVGTSATARAAAIFLAEARERMPIRSIQVDGGSEFMADFETACEADAIPLHVLPPRRPDINGHVERSNRTLRIEFWHGYRGELTVKAVNGALADYLDDYHRVRPHQALDWLTPAEMQNKLAAAA